MDNNRNGEIKEAISQEKVGSTFRSLKDLLDHVSGKKISGVQTQQDSGIADVMPFPFLAIVGQLEMKYALLMALINPAIGGVLLIGPRGTGKTTAVRGLIDLVPEIPRSLCYYGCLPEDVETGGIDAVCPNCAKKYASGEPLAVLADIRLVELPLNSRIEDVVGVVDETITGPERLRLKRGILAHADRNLLLVDEVNLLDNEVADAVMDAASYGSYTVRRGTSIANFKSRFVMVGTMNPEEGSLRSQIMDRFGLRIVVTGLTDRVQRYEAYQRVQTYLSNPLKLMLEYIDESKIARSEVQIAKDRLPNVKITDELAQMALDIIHYLQIDSLRAEITLLEGARAFAALDSRMEVNRHDIQMIAPMALRMRHSNFMEKFISERAAEEEEINNAINRILNTQ